MAAVVLQTPSSWTPEMIATAANTLTANVATVFNAAFLEAWGIEGVSVTVVSDLPPVPKKLSQAAQIGIGVGAGVGGLALVGGGVAVAMSRKRRAAVEPRDRMV